VLNIQNCELKKCIYQSKQYCIAITLKDKKSITYIDCMNDANLTNWYRAFEKASKLHEEVAKRHRLPLEHRKCLGLDPNIELTQKAITKAYRKLSLKVDRILFLYNVSNTNVLFYVYRIIQAHPDKGGDVHKFSDIHQAYTQLMALQVEIDEKKKCIEVPYEAAIQKVLFSILWKCFSVLFYFISCARLVEV
jgi:hypothetical protein